MTTGNRWQTFFHALAFVLGFSAIFIALGASVAFFGSALNPLMSTIAKIGGGILILFGLQVAGVLGWIADRIRAGGGDGNMLGRAYLALVDLLGRLMYTEGRVQMNADPRLGYLASFIMGIFFSAGWIPCVGPVLSAILGLASQVQTVAQGAGLLAVYSAGLGLPFLITGAALATVTPLLRRMNRHLGIVSKITGIFLILMGVLLYSNRLTIIANLLVGQFGTGLASVELGGAGLTSAISIPIAFIAGLLSFLSPCVLPLIPAYIGYLSGTSVAGRPTSA